MKPDLKTYAGADKVITSHDMAKIISEKEKARPTVKMRSKIPTLDVQVDGFRGGEMVVLSGDEGMGKTLLARTLTKNLTAQGKRCMWFSYEETPGEFLKKFGDDLPEFLMPMEIEGSLLDWIATRILEAKAKYGDVHAVFIDHLHYLIDQGLQNVSLEIGRVTRFLKLFAVKHNLVLFLICHTNRNSDGGEPINASLRDSGMTAKEASTIIFIWRMDDDPLAAMLKITKCRETGVRNVYVKLRKAGNFLVEPFDTKKK